LEVKDVFESTMQAMEVAGVMICLGVGAAVIAFLVCLVARAKKALLG
jgi:hypothetical protein